MNSSFYLSVSILHHEIAKFANYTFVRSFNYFLLFCDIDALMLILIGFAVVYACVLSGYVGSGGALLALWHPLEILIIVGAAIGAFIAANPMHVIKEVLHNLGGLFGASKYTKEYYMDLLALMHDLFVKCRKEGLIAIESDIEDPHASEIFQRYPRINKNHHVIEFICDYLRICSSGNMSPFELENLLDVELDTIAGEGAHIAHAVNRIAEGLPGFRIGHCYNHGFDWRPT